MKHLFYASLCCLGLLATSNMCCSSAHMTSEEVFEQDVQEDAPVQVPLDESK